MKIGDETCAVGEGDVAIVPSAPYHSSRNTNARMLTPYATWSPPKHALRNGTGNLRPTPGTDHDGKVRK